MSAANARYNVHVPRQANGTYQGCSWDHVFGSDRHCFSHLVVQRVNEDEEEEGGNYAALGYAIYDLPWG